MTVEALVFIALGLLAVGFILKIASGNSSRRKQDTRSLKAKLESCPPLPREFEAEVSKLVESKKLINAIKYVREITKLDLRDSKELVDLVKAGKSLHDLCPEKVNGNGNGNGNELEVSSVGKETTPDDRDSAPTAELQTIDNIEAIQRVQILISKGQTIEAVQYLCDNAGYDKKRALALVETMGKKVYSSD